MEQLKKVVQCQQCKCE